MPPTDELTILVPLDISKPELPPLESIDLLGPAGVVLLGYFPVPRQAEPALIRDEYEAEAEARLVEIAEGRPGLTEVLVFTHDREATIDRVAAEYGCDAVVTTGEIDEIGRVLVPLRGDANLERIVSVVAALLRACDATATFFHAVDEHTDRSQAEFLLRGTTERVTDYEIDEDRVDWAIAEGEEAHSAIIEEAVAYDLVVLGETEPSLRERIIGSVLTRIIDTIEKPVLIVRGVE